MMSDDVTAKKWYERSDARVLAAFLSSFATAIALVQIGLHLKHYSNGNHQRHILRIIFLVPIYAVLSLAALTNPKHSLDLDKGTCKITCKGKSCLRACGRARESRNKWTGRT